MMEANFFKNVQNLDIGGGNFNMYNGPDNRRITHRQTKTINDRSTHTTNYGGYTNYGQHADNNGRIYNGEQRMNNRPVNYGHNDIYDHPIDFSNDRSSSDDDWDNYSQPPPRQTSSYRQGAGDQGYYNPSSAAARNAPRVGKKWTKEPTLPRARPNQSFDPSSLEFQREYENMTPKMKAYFQSLGYEHTPKDSLNDRMASVSLEDPGVLRSCPPRDYERYNPNAARKGKNVADRSSHDSEEEPDEEYDEDEDDDFAPGNSQQFSSSYVHNDHRVITKNVNSNNVNTENVVDSYNDNSTRTNIKKNSAR